MEENMNEEIFDRDISSEVRQSPTTPLHDLEKIDEKGQIRHSTKKFVNDIIKILTTYIDIAERIDEEYKKAAIIIAQIETFYDREKATFAQFKKLTAEKRLSVKELYYHATDIQDILEGFEENFAELIRVSRMMIEFFVDKRDCREFNNKIDTASRLFTQIYNDIQDIAFEEQKLAKTL